MAPRPQTIERRLAKVGPLKSGAHEKHDAFCIMEAVAFVACEPWSDSPECASPVISAFLRSWNDSLDDERRNKFLRPFIRRLINTRGNDTLETRRATMAVDWFVRVHTPAWLRLAGLTIHADALASLPEIIDFARCPSLMPALEAARRAAKAAANAAWAAAWNAAWNAARDAARDADGAAAGAAAWAAAWYANGAALKPTVIELQQSALVLVERMIECTP
jgi:hypothetical protein